MFELIAAPHTPLDGRGELKLEAVARQAAHLRAAGVGFFDWIREEEAP